MTANPCSVPDWLRVLLPLETPRQQGACRKHDEAYARGGTRADRLQADLDFCDDLLWADMDPDRAEQYLWGVRMYGASHWNGIDGAGALPPREPDRTEAP